MRPALLPLSLLTISLLFVYAVTAAIQADAPMKPAMPAVNSPAMNANTLRLSGTPAQAEPSLPDNVVESPVKPSRAVDSVAPVFRTPAAKSMPPGYPGPRVIGTPGVD